MADLLNSAADQLGGRYAGANINRSTPGKWERGDRGPYGINADLLCVVFNATPDELGLVRRREVYPKGGYRGGCLKPG